MSAKSKRIFFLFLILFVFILLFSHVSYSHSWLLQFFGAVEQFADPNDRTYVFSNYKKDDNVKVISFNVATSPLDPNSQSHL